MSRSTQCNSLFETDPFAASVLMHLLCVCAVTVVAEGVVTGVARGLQDMESRMPEVENALKKAKHDLHKVTEQEATLSERVRQVTSYNLFDAML